MNTNLIQNYTSTSRAPQKSTPDFNVFIKAGETRPVMPLPSHGKLVRSGAKFGYKTKSLADGLSGKANDHQIGKLNDLGMVLGGLLIATYLFTKKKTPLTKGMEFLGFGAFFASMALWPKLAIQLPAQIVHGFNVQRKYKDSYGRKKPVYQDPQYIPWDLYSDKQINKIGNRLGVDKNLPNRRQAIQEKMKKIAVQNNTLWMLTAGFATPVMSALICTAAEKPLLKYQENIKNKNADKILANIDNVQAPQVSKELEQVLKAAKGQEVTDEIIKTITKSISGNLDAITMSGVEADLKRILANDKHLLNREVLKSVLEESVKDLEPSVKIALPTLDEATDLFAKSGLLDKELDEQGVFEAKKLISKQFVLKARAAEIPDDTIISEQSKFIDIAKKGFSKTTTAKLDDTAISKVREIYSIMSKFIAKTNSLDKYAQIKVGATPETVLANSYNEIQNSLIKLLDITPDEIKQAKQDRLLANKLLREKFEAITSSDDKYRQVVEQLSEKIAQIDKKIKSQDTEKYLKKVDEVFDKAAEELAKKGMASTAQKLTALNVDAKGSLKNVQKTMFENRLLGAKSSFYRLLNSLDVFRRISKGDLGADLKGVEREVKEELAELAKQTLIGGRASDFETKLPFARNINPSPEVSDIQVVSGKVKNKFFGKSPRVEIASDYRFYQRAMDLMFGEAMDADTAKSLEKSGILDKLKRYKSDVWHKIGGSDYFLRPHHRTCGDATATSEFKFLLTGQAPDDMLVNVVRQTFNSKKWLKIFGKFGAALLGVTVLSQFFFGKTRGDKIQ